MRRPKVQRWVGWAAAAVAGALTLFVCVSLYVQLRYRDRVVASSAAPQVPWAMVFGAGLQGGEPSPVLAQRLDLAIALYRSHRAERLLVSGDDTDGYHLETAAMERYLVQRGVPRDRIDADGEGVSTFSTCERAYRKFGVRRALLITQRFHLPRALYVANHLGIEAWGVAADEANPHSTYAWREFVSRPVAWFLVLLGPE